MMFLIKRLMIEIMQTCISGLGFENTLNKTYRKNKKVTKAYLKFLSLIEVLLREKNERIVMEYLCLSFMSFK